MSSPNYSPRGSMRSRSPGGFRSPIQSPVNGSPPRSPRQTVSPPQMMSPPRQSPSGSLVTSSPRQTISSPKMSPGRIVSPPQSPLRSPVMSPRGSPASSPDLYPRHLKASPRGASPEYYKGLSPVFYGRFEREAGVRMNTYLILSPGSANSDSTTDLSVKESHPVLFQLQDNANSPPEVVVVYKARLSYDDLQDGSLNLGHVYISLEDVHQDILDGMLDDMLVDPLSMMYRRQQGLNAEMNFLDGVRAAGGAVSDSVRRNAADILIQKRKLGTDDESSIYITVVTLPNYTTQTRLSPRVSPRVSPPIQQMSPQPAGDPRFHESAWGTVPNEDDLVRFNKAWDVIQNRRRVNMEGQII